MIDKYKLVDIMLSRPSDQDELARANLWLKQNVQSKLIEKAELRETSYTFWVYSGDINPSALAKVLTQKGYSTTVAPCSSPDKQGHCDFKIAIFW